MSKAGVRKGFKALGAYKNWLILGAALVGGYFIYKKIAGAKALQLDTSGPPPVSPASQTRSALDPDPNGPHVKAGVLVATKSAIRTTAKLAGYVYAKIIRTDAQGYMQFKSKVDGTFTRRLFQKGKNLWAEIKPDVPVA